MDNTYNDEMMADRSFFTHNGSLVSEIGDEQPEPRRDELIDQLVQLRLELASTRSDLKAFETASATARIRGRVHGHHGQVVYLAVEDGEGHQRLAVRVPNPEDREVLAVGLRADLACHFQRGRLVLARILDTQPCDDLMPLLPEPERKASTVPDWFDSQAKNAKRELLKASDGSSSVSELRVHLVWGTKRRGKILTAPMVERIKVLADEVVKAKNLGRLLAVNGESDHCHVALWLPANLAGSEAMGIIKGYVSRHLRREFPQLMVHDDEALWQRGGFVGSIGAAGHLEAVLTYIKSQDAPQDDQEEVSLPSVNQEAGNA